MSKFNTPKVELPKTREPREGPVLDAGHIRQNNG